MNDFVAGLVGGLGGLVVGHPLDTVKALMQTSNQTNIISSTKNIIKNTSLKGYFRGLTMPFISYGPLNSMLFGIYGNTLRLLHDDGETPTYFHVWLAGTAAGSILALPTNPFELVKIQLQTHDSKSMKGINECVRDVIRNEGYRGLFRGFPALFWRDSLSYGFYFCSFEYIRRTMKQKGYMNEYFNEFLAGGIAGSAAWFLILPLDIVKTRQQSDKDKNIGIIESMKKLSREQGLRANFTLGLWPLLVRGFLVNATTFLIYSQTLKLL